MLVLNKRYDGLAGQRTRYQHLARPIEYWRQNSARV